MNAYLSRFVRFSALLVVPIAAGCGDSAAPVGGERQACYANGTCNAGLTCATNSNICVDLGGTGGRGGGGGAQAGSSGGSIAGSGGSNGGGGSVAGASGTTGTGGTAGTGGTTGTGGTAGTGGTTGTGGGTAGTGGTTGTGGGAAGRGGSGGGNAGTTGSAGTGGTAGTTGTAGTAGTTGAAGTGGSAGTTGTAGTGGGTAGTGGTGGTGGSAGTTGTAGTGGSSGTAGTGGTSPCLVSANYGTIGRATTPAARMPSSDIKWRLPLEAGTPTDQVRLDLFYNYGVFKPGAVKTGTYTLAGDELSYRWCGLCVIIDEGVSGNTVRGYYMATGGSVTLTSVAGKLTGQMTNVTLQHVNIDQDTLVNTPHPDGCTSAIGTLLFDVDITN